MSYTAVVNNKTSASSLDTDDLGDLEDNVTWLRKRPTLRIYSDAFNQGTVADDGGWDYIVYDDLSDSWFEEWVEPATNSYSIGAATVVNEIYLGDEEEGIWLTGGYFGWKLNAAGWRGGRLTREPGGEVIARRQMSADSTNAGEHEYCGMHLCAPFNFTTSNERLQMAGRQTSTGNLEIQQEPKLPPRWWAHYMGSTTSFTTDWPSDPYSRADGSNLPSPTSDLDVWWNDIANKQDRLNSRPAARVRLTSAHSATTGSWNDVVFDTETYDNDAMVDGTEQTIDVAEDGYYWVSHGVRVNTMTNGAATVSSRIEINGTTAKEASYTSATPGSATSQACTVHGNVLLKLDAGDTVGVQLYHNEGANQNIDGSHATYLAVTQVAWTTAILSNDRQDWSKTGLPEVLPNAGTMSSTRIPLGYMRTMASVMEFLALPFVYKRRSKSAVGNVTQNNKWTKVSLANTVWDPHDYDDEDTGMNVQTSSGGVKVPYAGTYLVVGFASMDNEDENGDAIGARGSRGVRLTVNDAQIGRHRDHATGNDSGTESLFRNSVAEVHVCAAGDEIDLEVYSRSEEESGIPVTFAELAVVWLGDGLTLTTDS